jgi:hypothetical protein
MVPDSPLVDSESFADEREWDKRVIFRAQDSADGTPMFAKGQTRIERVVLQQQFEEVAVLAEHSWVWRDLGPNTVDENDINRRID